MQTAQAALAAEVIAVFEANAVALEVAAETATGWVLAWNTGLGVAFSEAGSPYACGVLHAEVIVTPEQAAVMPEEAWAFTPQVKNGNGLVADVVLRKNALLAAAKQTRDHIETMKARAA